MALEQELAHYKSIREQLLQQHEGKFALIIENILLGVYDTPEEAYRIGTTQRGNVPMLIKHIIRTEIPERLPAMTLGLLSAHL